MQGSGRPCAILIVDDEPPILRMLTRVLAELDCRLLTADSAEAALQIIRSDPPDLVITDIRMPGMDGIQLATAIHAHHPELPVVLMSAYGEPRHRDVGAGFIPKPFDNDQVLDQVSRFIETRRWVANHLSAGYGGAWTTGVWFGCTGSTDVVL